MVGTGDGRNLGFMSNMAHVVEIDPAQPELLAAHPVGSAVGSPWALAQWEGRAWLFSQAATGGSTVDAFDLETGDLVHIADLDVSVVGAAASSCAPFAPVG